MNLLALWNRVSWLPFGSLIFSRLLCFKVPYTGTIRPHVLSLSPGRVRVQMRDRHGVRNHLKSIHAIALINLGEVSSGLAVLTLLPPGARAIVTKLEIEYFKKARGTLIADCDFAKQVGGSLGVISDKKPFQAIAEIFDRDQSVVARVKAEWLVSMDPKYSSLSSSAQ